MPNLDLSSLERKQLEEMACDPLVRKFGHKMAYCRQRDATQVMRVSKDFLSEEVLTTMFQKYFEPSRIVSDLVMIGVHFLEFALCDVRCRELIKQGEPFLQDLMVYDHARAFIVHQVVNLQDATLPPKSLLRHTAFLIKNFQYDVTTADKLKVKNPESRVIPALKPMKLIFLRFEQPPYYRIFQIDETIERFLKVQKETPENWNEPLPPAYPAMVSVGLCKKQEDVISGLLQSVPI